MGIGSVFGTILRVIKYDVSRFHHYLFKTWGVHTEAVFNDKVWEQVVKRCKSKKLVWFCITPVNHDYACTFFGLTLSKEDYSRLLARKYRELQRMGQRVELHVHLSTLPNMAEKEQRRMMTEALQWMRNNGFNVSEFVPGWWSYNPTLRRIVDDLGLKAVKKSDYYAIHDYDFVTENDHLQ